MNTRSTLFTTLAVATATVVAAPLAQAQVPVSPDLIGLSDDNTLTLIIPDAQEEISVTGLGDGLLEGIDFRPADGKLYGVTNTNKLYTIDPNTGAATLASTLSTSFDAGFQSGVDFNPALDALRLNGSNEQNFSTKVDTGVVTPQTTLSYISGDSNQGKDPKITAAAYTQSFLGPPNPPAPAPPTRTTQLYGIDYDLDVLVLQNPPPTGNLTTIGSLGVDFDTTGGFDIFTDTDGKDIAYALSGSSLYNINLSTGASTVIQTVDADPDSSFVGFAARPVPEPSSILGVLAFGAFGAGSYLKNRRSRRKLASGAMKVSK